MNAYFLVKFDGEDERRLKQVLAGETFRDVLLETLRHLYWWYSESEEDAEAYALVYDFMMDAMISRGVQMEGVLTGKVRTRGGEIVEKTEEDLRRRKETQPAASPPASGRLPAPPLGPDD